jgi:hypothetical protein
MFFMGFGAHIFTSYKLKCLETTAARKPRPEVGPKHHRRRRETKRSRGGNGEGLSLGETFVVFSKDHAKHINILRGKMQKCTGCGRRRCS